MSFLGIFLPILDAALGNKVLNKKMNDFTQEGKQEEKTELWLQKLIDSEIPEQTIESISNSIFTGDNQRTYNIENKGSSLLVGVGVSISLLSIVLGFLITKNNFYIFEILSILFFSVAILNLILAAFCSSFSIKITKRYVMINDDIEDLLKKGKPYVFRLAAEYLSNVEFNFNLSQKKANWVDASQKHFLWGLVLIVIGFLLLTTGVFDLILNGSIDILFLSNSTNA